VFFNECIGCEESLISFAMIADTWDIGPLISIKLSADPHVTFNGFIRVRIIVQTIEDGMIKKQLWFICKGNVQGVAREHRHWSQGVNRE
jgi:hypothetical protein